MINIRKLVVVAHDFLKFLVRSVALQFARIRKMDQVISVEYI